MFETLFRKHKWDELLEKLKNRELPTEQIGSAIVKVGKPFEEKKILAAKDVIASYLDHPDDWVRHEAMWFLTSWGKLREYQPALLRALRHDPDVDNRSFAASCLGRLQKGTANREAIMALKAVVEDENEDELVRLYAYRSLLEIAKDESRVGFSPHDNKLSDIDWEWVRSLSRTTA